MTKESFRVFILARSITDVPLRRRKRLSFPANVVHMKTSVMAFTKLKRVKVYFLFGEMDIFDSWETQTMMT